MSFDLSAALAEREKKPAFGFEFGGEHFELPASPDLRAFAALTAGRLDDGFRLLLGADQWARLQAVDEVFDDTAFEVLFETYQQHIGTDLGESTASATS